MRIPDNLFQEVKAAPMDDCKQMWDFFDDRLPGDTMETLQRWAELGDPTEKIYKVIMEQCEPLFIGMGDAGRKALALAIEYAVRNSGQV